MKHSTEVFVGIDECVGVKAGYLVDGGRHRTRSAGIRPNLATCYEKSNVAGAEAS